MADREYFLGMFAQSLPVVLTKQATTNQDFLDKYQDFLDKMDPEWLASRILSQTKEVIARPITYHMGLTQDVIYAISNGDGYLDDVILGELRLETIDPRTVNPERSFGCKVFPEEFHSLPTLWSRNLFLQLNIAISEMFYNGPWWKKNIRVVNSAMYKYRVMGGIMDT